MGDEEFKLYGIAGLESCEEGEVVVNLDLGMPLLFQRVRMNQGPYDGKLGWITMGDDLWAPSADVVMYFELEGAENPMFMRVLGKR